MNNNKPPFERGETVMFGSEVVIVAHVFRTSIAPSGWLVECVRQPGIRRRAGDRTGLRDASVFHKMH